MAEVLTPASLKELIDAYAGDVADVLPVHIGDAAYSPLA